MYVLLYLKLAVLRTVLTGWHVYQILLKVTCAHGNLSITECRYFMGSIAREYIWWLRLMLADGI